MSHDCPDCVGIDQNPSHYEGEKPAAASILRCVLYEAFTLAITIQALQSIKWPADVLYAVPVGEPFGPGEVLKHAALMKMRLLYDFLYQRSVDDFCAAKDFTQFGVSAPLKIPALQGWDGGPLFTRKSINKFVAHLSKARITKPKCIPQPKFTPGLEATLANAKLILADVEAFASGIVGHRDFAWADDWGPSYWDGFLAAAACVRLGQPGASE